MFWIELFSSTSKTGIQAVYGFEEPRDEELGVDKYVHFSGSIFVHEIH